MDLKKIETLRLENMIDYYEWIREKILVKNNIWIPDENELYFPSNKNRKLPYTIKQLIDELSARTKRILK